MTFTDHLLPPLTLPQFPIIERSKNRYLERKDKNQLGRQSPHQYQKLRTTLLPPPLPTFNKNFQSGPIRASSSLRSPAFTSPVHTFTLINVLYFAQSFCHTLKLLFGHDKNLDGVEVSLGLPRCHQASVLCGGAVSTGVRNRL